MTRAYVTLVVTDNAAAGALVLAHRLRDLHDSRDPGQKLLCLVTSDVSANTHHALATVYEVVQVDTPRSKAALNLHLLGKPIAALSLAKVEIWNLTQYEKILYLDPDVLPLRPIDELFEFEELSAAPDVGWPDWFHTGVFVANPSRSTYAALKSMTEQDKVYEAGDQGLLNEHFQNWSMSGPSHRIPFTFNIVASAIYSYAPASKEFGKDVKMVRFSEDEKPWDWVRFQDGRKTAIAENLPQRDPLQAPELSDLGSLKNAWDTPVIMDNTDHLDERTFVYPLPPLPPITFQDEVWRSEEQHTQEQPSFIYAQSHHQPAEHTEHQEYHGHHKHQERHEYHEHHEHHQGHGHHEHQEHNIHHEHNEHQQDHGVHAPEKQDHTQEPQELEPAHIDLGHQEQSKVNDHYHHVPEENYRMLNWNPSWEEPPQEQNAVDMPDLQIYGNVWDNPQPDVQVWIPPSITELPPPPPSVDYHHQYIHSPAPQQSDEIQHLDAHPPPVFPWEEAKEVRHLLTRIWQDEQELEKRAREEEENRRIETEKAAAEAERIARESEYREQDHYQEHHNHHPGDVGTQQEVVQQAWEAKNEIIEQTISESASHPQEQPSTLDQPFVSVWDHMPDIQKYLARIGVQDAFKHSEYQPLTSENPKEDPETMDQEEHAAEEEEAESNDDSVEEYEELEEDSELDEEENEDHVKITEPVHLDIDPPPTLAQSWWGEPFAIDSMPTTPLIGKSGARSPMLPMTPRLEDDDWDDRDLIPLPLKRTSKLFQGDLSLFPESKSPKEVPKPESSLPPVDTTVKQKKKRRVKKLRKLFADEDDMIKKTPFTSAVTTPTSEKSFILPIADIKETVVESVVLPRSESFGEYKIEWASDLLKGHEGVVTPARTPSKEVVSASGSYFDGTPAASPSQKKKSKYNIYASRSTWDPLHALKSLKASGEKLLIKTKFESAETEDSDEEYAPAAYYNNDDEEDLGVLGLTFPTSRVKKEYAMSKMEDSPPNYSESVSPATPTAKGMSMNLTDKIMQEAVERRINTDIALHEAATSLVKSTEAAYNDDGYAMSPTTEEFPNFNVSATELEMSQDNSSKRRRSTAESEGQFDSQAALVREEQGKGSENESKEVPSEKLDRTSDPVHNEIIQAATDKLKQIAGIDWEAAAKEDASHMEDTKNWVFAQRHEEVITSTSASGVNDTFPISISAKEDVAKNAGEPMRPVHLDNQPANYNNEDEQDKSPKILSEVAATQQPEYPTPAVTGVDKSVPEVSVTSPSVIAETNKDITAELTKAESTSSVGMSNYRSNAPGPLSFSSDDLDESETEGQRRDELKTPTQSSFSVSTLAHSGKQALATPDDASESTSSLPEDVEQKLVDTVETLVRKVEANEPVTSATEVSAAPMDRVAAGSQLSIEGAESARSHLSNPIERQLEVPGDSIDQDDTSSDTQWLSATEGDPGSESGTSADWFSVQSFNNSANQSEDEDHQLHGGSDIHRDFLRRFVDNSDLQHEISSLDSGAPYVSTERGSTYEDPLVSDEGVSTTEDNESA
ncbi:unnamed protein product [Umbelopsis sp. WA50703]